MVIELIDFEKINQQSLQWKPVAVKVLLCPTVSLHTWQLIVHNQIHLNFCNWEFGMGQTFYNFLSYYYYYYYYY
jgi:hypothetical protein